MIVKPTINKTLESYLGFLVDNDLTDCFDETTLNRTSLENKSANWRPAHEKGLAPETIGSPLKTNNYIPLTDRTKVTSTNPLSQKTYNNLEALSEIKNLTSFYDYLKNKSHSNLKAEANNNLIEGFGAENPDILLLGDVLDTIDDNKKTGFNSIGHRLVIQAIEQAGLADKFYACHCTFWRPMGGRPLTQDDILFNKPLVEVLIRLLMPKIILILGPQASLFFNQNDKKSLPSIGEIFPYNFNSLENEIECIISYSPSLLASQPASKATFWLQLLTLKKRMTKEII